MILSPSKLTPVAAVVTVVRSAVVFPSLYEQGRCLDGVYSSTPCTLSSTLLERHQGASPALPPVALVGEQLLGCLPSRQRETQVTTASGVKDPMVFSGW